MRLRAAKLTQKKKVIEWRSHEPSRLETFSDAVFAFAVTLIIVSLEVPKSFSDLYETMKGTGSFAVCFALLFLTWNNQNLFFRYYGLKDARTVALNAALLFVVLIYVYPLKFLFNLVFLSNHYTENGQIKLMIQDKDVPILMILYALGYTIINFLFFLMYRVAISNRELIKLNAIELFETKTIASIYLICSFIGVTAILFAVLLPQPYVGFSGFFYMIIGPAYYVWYSYRRRKRKRIFGSTELHLA